MKKQIRSTYPVEFSVGLLILIFVLAFVISTQLFDIPWRELMEGRHVSAYVGMFLISCAVIIVILILWEEFLFPVSVKHDSKGVTFRNHRTKLKTQLFIYFIIPGIFTFVYLNFPIHTIRFFIWATVCTILPIGAKLISGINNYNDFLQLTEHTIEFKNNKKSGMIKVSDIERIHLIKDEAGTLHKFKLVSAGSQETVDLDEMELDAFLPAIEESIVARYGVLIR